MLRGSLALFDDCLMLIFVILVPSWSFRMFVCLVAPGIFCITAFLQRPYCSGLEREEALFRVLLKGPGLGTSKVKALP